MRYYFSTGLSILWVSLSLSLSVSLFPLFLPFNPQVSTNYSARVLWNLTNSGGKWHVSISWLTAFTTADPFQWFSLTQMTCVFFTASWQCEPQFTFADLPQLGNVNWNKRSFWRPCTSLQIEIGGIFKKDIKEKTLIHIIQKYWVKGVKSTLKIQKSVEQLCPNFKHFQFRCTL